MTNPRPIQFGEWLPDLGSVNNPGATVAKNVIPQINGYRELKSLTTFTNALGSACLGAFWVPDAVGEIENFAGDNTKLYKLDDFSAYQDVSRSPGAAYNATRWEFTKFGTRVIAASKSDVLQKFDLGTDTRFSDLAGSPPQGATIATVRDFVMLGNIDSLGPNYVQWSAYNNSEIWTPSLQYQSDFQPLFGRGGTVQRIVPGEYAIIFMEQSIFIGEYSGPPTIFQFDEVDRKRGTPAPNSVIWLGDQCWFYGYDGFYSFSGSRGSEPISHNRVSQWFEAEAATDGLETMRGAIDRGNGLLIWAFRSTTTVEYNDRLIIYNLFADKWSYAEVNTELIDEYVSPGYSLDALDAILPNGIDVDSIPVDSTQYQGGKLSLIAFDPTHTGATFDGPALTGCVETTELSKEDSSATGVNNIRPVIEGGAATSVTIEVGKRNTLRENKVFSAAKAPNAVTGEVNVRQKGRFLTYRANISGGFDKAFGVIPKEINSSGGKR